jgi:type IV pilus biogenesis protein CpaD/CtpE
MKTESKKLVAPGFAVLVLALTLVACATGPTQLEQTFGDSVRHMIRAQTYDPATLESPATETVEGADGPRLENALEAYRTGVTTPQEGGGDVIVNVGGGD